MVKTGIPFMLEHKASFLGYEFPELYGRLHLNVDGTRRDPDGTSKYAIYDSHLRASNVTLEYGPGGALGNITVVDSGGVRRTSTMSSFLVQVGGNSRHRKFTAPDGQEYVWGWRTNAQEGDEWTCVNASGQTVAWYVLKIPGTDSSCRWFGVEEPYPHLAVVFLATLLIMRHIVAHNM